MASKVERVRPPVEPLTVEDARHLLAAGLLTPVHEQGPKRVGLKMGCDEKTVRKARDKETTLRVDHSWNALLVDDQALGPIAGHFNKLLIDLVPIEGGDMATISGLLHAATEYFDRMKDNNRCYKDTLVIADLFRPLLPPIAAIVHEADLIRAGGK